MNYGPNTGLYSYFNRQYSSLYAWRSIGNASYNALEVTLKKNFSQGLHGIERPTEVCRTSMP